MALCALFCGVFVDSSSFTLVVLVVVLNANFLARSTLHLVTDSSSVFIKSLFNQNTLAAKMNRFSETISARILRPMLRARRRFAFGFTSVPNVSTQCQKLSTKTSLFFMDDDFGENGRCTPSGPIVFFVFFVFFAFFVFFIFVFFFATMMYTLRPGPSSSPSSHHFLRHRRTRRTRRRRNASLSSFKKSRSFRLSKRRRRRPLFCRDNATVVRPFDHHSKAY